MAFTIDLDNVSFEQIKLDIINTLKTKPDYAQWESFYSSSAGVTFIELCASVSTYLAQKTTIGRRENYLAYVKNRSSAVAIAETLTYNVNRGHNDYLYILVQADSTIALGEWDIIGSVKDKDLILKEAVSLVSGNYYILPVIVGEIKEETTTISSSELQVFRFTSENVSQDIKIFINSDEVDLSSNIVDLSDDKYVALTNTLGAVDVMYLNRSSVKTSWVSSVYYDVADFIEPSVATGFIYRCDIYGESGFSEPTWPTTAGQSVADGTTRWTAYEDLSYDTSDILTLKYIELNELDYTIPADVIFDYGNLESFVYYNTTIWIAATVYEVGNYVVPLTSPGLYFYECTTAGTSAASPEPTWPLIVGNTVTDGTVVWTCISADVKDSEYQAIETIDSIRVNAPVSFSTQQLVKGRDDYMKLFNALDTSIVDTNYQDTGTPGIVELSYVKNDLSVFTSGEKTTLLSDLAKYRPLGLQEPTISDPKQNILNLNITVYLKEPGTYDLADLVDEVVDGYNKELELSLDLFQLENQISNLVDSNNDEFIKTSRIVVDTTTWIATTAYITGDFVIPITPNGYMYRATISGDSDSSEPSWPTVVGDTVVDDEVTWQCYSYTATSIDLNWDEYATFVVDLTIV